MISETKSPALDLVGEPAPGLLSFGVHQRRKDLVVSSTRSPKESRRPQPKEQAVLTAHERPPPQWPRYCGVLRYAVELATGDLFELVTAHCHGNADAVERLQGKILALDHAVNNGDSAFAQMLIGEAAIELLRQAPGTDYHTAEFSIRATLRKFVPELPAGPVFKGGHG
jgi:hypothetical protein